MDETDKCERAENEKEKRKKTIDDFSNIMLQS